MQKVSEEVYNRINNEIYNQDGDRWWQPDFSLNLIKTLMNPFRVGYALKILERLKINPEGKTALEVGCGGGILCEEIARIGFNTIGIDPAKQSIITASKHALKNGGFFTNVETIGRGFVTPGGKPKNPYCQVCNIHTQTGYRDRYEDDDEDSDDYHEDDVDSDESHGRWG